MLLSSPTILTSFFAPLFLLMSCSSHVGCGNSRSLHLANTTNTKHSGHSLLNTKKKSKRNTPSPNQPLTTTLTPSHTTNPNPPTTPFHCDFYNPPEITGTIDSDQIDEASGLAASLLNPNILWTHNDSGDHARAFALGTNAKLHAILNLDGVTASDIEDIDEAPCSPTPTSNFTLPAIPNHKRCLWLADTGDNAQNRGVYQIYRVPEPDLHAAATIPTQPQVQQLHTTATTFQFTYPHNESINSEGMIITGDGSRVLLFEKTKADQARVFIATLPAIPPATPIRLKLLTKIASPGFAINEHGRKITAADMSADGNRILIRVYTGTFEYQLPRLGASKVGEARLVSLLSSQPMMACLGPYDEAQGEAVTFAPDGHSFWTVSENRNQPLHRYVCDEKTHEKQ